MSLKKTLVGKIRKLIEHLGGYQSPIFTRNKWWFQLADWSFFLNKNWNSDERLIESSYIICPTPTLNIIESTPPWGITFGLILEREKVRNDITFFGNRNHLCSIISRVFLWRTRKCKRNLDAGFSPRIKYKQKRVDKSKLQKKAFSVTNLRREIQSSTFSSATFLCEFYLFFFLYNWSSPNRFFAHCTCNSPSHILTSKTRLRQNQVPLLWINRGLHSKQIQERKEKQVWIR